MTFDVQHGTPADLPAMLAASALAFGLPAEPDDLEDVRAVLDPTRFLLARADGAPRIVAKTGSIPFPITLPGGTRLPAAGITAVTVAPTHRRRGLLRTLLTAQHRELAADGVALSALTASEGGIYRRFGYGVATYRQQVSIDRRAVAFRADAPDPGGVRLLDADEAAAVLPALHERWAAVTPGAIGRGDWAWRSFFADRPANRGGASQHWYLAHPDGYACYRRQGREILVDEVFAITDDAHAALWRVLAQLDLAEHIVDHHQAPDDVLPHLLVDHRAVTTTELPDGIWARVLDVPAVLSARRYGQEIDVVLEVRDGHFGESGPDVTGRYRLRGGPDGATCARTDTTPDLTLDVATLGSLLLGGVRVPTLAAARLLDCPDPALRHRLDLALLTPRAPRHGTEF